MKTTRRDALGMAGVAAAAVAMSTQTKAQAQPARAYPSANPLKMTDVTMMMTPSGPGLGVKTPRGVLSVSALEREQKKGLPTTVADLIAKKGNIAALQGLLANGAASAPAKFLVAEDKVVFAKVLDNPPKIICVGLNYLAHIQETGGARPTADPILFNKYNTALNAHKGTIKVSTEPAKEWDYEAELVMIMGKGGRAIPENEALSYVFGYASGNDFSARDLQRRSAQWMLGKTVDGSGPFGPWVVSADQVDVNDLDMKMIVNGVVKQTTNTKLMIFNCAQIIAYCSKHFMLEAGDVIFTGTCDGTITGLPRAQQVWLKPGDKMVTTISKIGDLEVTLT